MKLCKQDISENKREWQEKGYLLPQFDIEQVRKATYEAPEWVHFGTGNIFRAFLASAAQQQLDAGRMKKGIVAVSGQDYESIDLAYRRFDDLCLSVTLKADGSIDKRVVASVTEALKLDPADADFARLREIFADSSLKMVSLTITEKGYNIKDADGRILPSVQADFAARPEQAQTYLGKIAALLYLRYRAGKLPIAMVSMDNCFHNGSRLMDTMTAFADAWVQNGLAEPGFAEYLRDPDKVGFPWTMIDKITPRLDGKVIDMIHQDGLEGIDPVKTARGSSATPVVNAEETQYLIIEDHFPNGRIELEGADGILFTERETVDKVEHMKVCTCLNPLHTALAVFGCLLGCTRISEEMKDPLLKKMVEVIGYREGLPAVVDPGILNPKEFMDTVVNVRFPNVFMPDTPQRIATDTSQKLPIRFGETVKVYHERQDLSMDDLKLIPLVFAGWLRYTLGIDDEGQPFAPSSDPMLSEVQARLAGIRLGDQGPFSEKLHPILSNAHIFGVDLYEVGLGERVEQDFVKLIAAPHAVRRTLDDYLN